MTVDGVRVVNHDGSTYPIDLEYAVDIYINVTNAGTDTFDHMNVAASLSRYTTVFGQCSWVVIPTFGLLYADFIQFDIISCLFSAIVSMHAISTSVHWNRALLPHMSVPIHRRSKQSFICSMIRNHIVSELVCKRPLELSWHVESLRRRLRRIPNNSK